MAAHFETYRQAKRKLGKDYEWGWRLQDGNNEIIATGEGYVTKANAERGVTNVIQTVLDIVDADGEVEVTEA